MVLVACQHVRKRASGNCADSGESTYDCDLFVDPPGVSFTNYDLRLPGPDKILNTDDDFIVHDGVVMKLSELPPSSSASSANSLMSHF